MATDQTFVQLLIRAPREASQVSAVRCGRTLCARAARPPPARTFAHCWRRPSFGSTRPSWATSAGSRGRVPGTPARPAADFRSRRPFLPRELCRKSPTRSPAPRVTDSPTAQIENEEVCWTNCCLHKQRLRRKWVGRIKHFVSVNHWTSVLCTVYAIKGQRNW